MIGKTFEFLYNFNLLGALTIKGDEIKINNPISNAEMLTLVVSIANLCFVIYFYFKDIKNKEKEDIFKKKSFWFRNVILEKKLNRIESFWGESNNVFKDCLSNLENSEEIRTKVSGVLTEKRSIIKDLNDYLRMLDDTIGQHLDDVLDDFEDYYTKTISGLLLGLEEKSKTTILVEYEKGQGEYEKKYMSSLYDFELNGYECKEN